MENKNNNEMFKNLTDIPENGENEVYVEEIVVGEIAEKVDDTDEFVTVGDVAVAPSKITKKQWILIIAACLAVFALAIFVLPSPKDNKQDDDGDVSPLENAKTTTQNLMDEFAQEHGLVVTTTDKNVTTTLTSTTVIKLTRPATSTTVKTSQTVTTTKPAVYDPSLYADLHKIDYATAIEEISSVNNLWKPDDYEGDKKLPENQFDPTQPTAPVYENMVYSERYYTSSYVYVNNPTGKGLMSYDEMKRIVDNAVEVLGFEVIKIGYRDYFGDTNTGAYYDTVPDPNGYYNYSALCKGGSVTIKINGEFNANISRYELPEGYKDFKWSWIHEYDTNVGEVRKTYQYFIDTYRGLLDMENPVFNDGTEKLCFMQNPYADYDYDNIGVYDKNGTKYKNPYVVFRPEYGQLSITRNYEPREEYYADYPILTPEEAAEKVLKNTYLKDTYQKDVVISKENIINYSTCYNDFMYQNETHFRLPFYVFLIRVNGFQIYDPSYDEMTQAYHYYNEELYAHIAVPAIKDDFIG